MPPIDVVTFGETMVLLAAVEAGPLRFANTFTRHAAGTESNVAIGLARLGQRVGWFSRLGDDEFGQYILNAVRGEGVDTSRVVVDPEAPTGVVFKEKRELGPRRILYYRRGSAASRIGPTDLDPDYVAQARILHLTGVTLALSQSCREAVHAAAETARQRGVLVSFDPNLRLRLWSRDEARAAMRALLPLCDVVLPGLDEAELLTGQDDPDRAADAIRALGPRTVVVKLGPEGALGVTPSERTRAPGVRLERIVDPVGAGDGFAAGFLAGQLRGLGLGESLRLGNTVGAFATTVVGDWEGLPTWREVQELRLDLDVAR
ncbi:MAG TPA: sugar kinase [Chloroflexota bacterium]|nr:sugar kinase [Chloroflexota bacterium]